MIRRNRALLAILALTACLHVVGMVRTPLPSQDGLKFIRIAREFGLRPWADVVRSSDQHPLYPALIAAVHPAVASAIGDGPASWRVAAQGVSLLAMLATIPAFFAFARVLVGRRAALLATLLLALLPLMAELGHETLSDASALAFGVGALALGARSLTTGRVGPAIGCGALAGVGYLVRPEAAIVPGVVAVAGAVRRVGTAERPSRRDAEAQRGRGTSRLLRVPAVLRAIALLIPVLSVIAGYASIKGSVSEKRSLRIATGLGGGTGMSRAVPPWVPPGLDDPRWDFAPKEESDAPGRLGLAAASALLVRRTSEATLGVLIPLACWGAWTHRGPRRARAARLASGLLATGFTLILLHHAMKAGYLSDRHCALLVVAILPWAGFGAIDAARRIAARLTLTPARRHRLAVAALASLVVAGAIPQLKAGHPSRWGHAQAGRWIAGRAEPGAAVLDTRGWAAFVSGLRSYGPWHIRQALTDAGLAFVVVGEDELTAGSRRAETLRALLDYAAVPVAAFPERRGGAGVGVRVYRFTRPESWEGIVR